MTDSVLELRVGGVPFAHGDDTGRWRYRHAVRPAGPSSLDHQVVADFRAYERSHGRAVTVVADPELSDWATWTTPPSRPDPTRFPTQCCTHVFADGCSAPGLVCHGAPADAVAAILKKGELSSSTWLTGRDSATLAADSTWGEPPDYFDHVMLANGRCTAPEAVANSRRLGRDLVPTDLTSGYEPAARFYFRWDRLVSHTRAVFDGVHPIKIRDRLRLDDLLVAVILPQSGRDVHRGAHRDRIIVRDATGCGPEQWADVAAEAALQSAG